MKFQAPTRTHKRMVCYYFVAGSPVRHRVATSLSGNFEFELPDDTATALYMPCVGADMPVGYYGWRGKEWGQVTFEKAQDFMRDTNPEPTPESKIELEDCVDAVVVQSDEIACELYEAALKYTADWDKKWAATKSAFKKVTKEPK